MTDVRTNHKNTLIKSDIVVSMKFAIKYNVPTN